MMPAKELAQYALLMLRQIERLGPIEQSRVMRVAVALLTEEVQQALHPKLVKDEP